MNVLDALGGRSDVLIGIDFETHWSKDYTLKKLTTEGYVRDTERFSVLGVSVKYADRPAVWLEESEFREWVTTVDWSRVTCYAHHAHFDGLILAHWYDVRPRFWLDTLSMARVLHGTEVGGSLAKLAEHYALGVKGDEVHNTQGKYRDDFTDEEFAALGAYACNDIELTHGLLGRMTLPVEELWLIDTTVRLFTEPTFEADQDVLNHALIDERAKKAAFLERVGVDKAVLSSSDKFAALLKSMGEDPPVKAGKRGEIYAFAKSDPGMQALLEHPRDEIRFLSEARLSVKSTIVETRTERMLGVSDRGPVPIYLKYSGAHTHRWSGGDKLNPQNLNRGGILRDALLAPPGHTLAVADSGQIEARVVAWLAGQSELLETFRRNDATDGDFYSDEGSRYFGRKLSKKETPIERQVSKSMVLGLGFGMGWPKFASELLKGMLGAPPVQFTSKEANQFGVSVSAFLASGVNVERMSHIVCRIPEDQLAVHCAVTAHFVEMYRRVNSRIPGLWETMNAVLRAMESGKSMRFGPISTRRNAILKPNGLELHYPDLKRGSSGEFSYTAGRKKHSKIYGGLLTENVVQSLARDIVAEQALWIRARGYKIVTLTHDEIVACVPDADGPECLEYMLERMRIPPTWCSDLPLNASGGVARSYGSAK